MIQPRKWWVGLLAVAPLWAWCTHTRTDAVEAAVGARARAALGQAGAETGVQVAGRDVTLTGQAASPQVAASASSAVDAAPGVRLVNSQLAALAAAKPYAFLARRDGDALTLEGFAPSSAARDSLVAAAKAAFPGAKVTDALKLASGAPAGFEAAAAFALAQAARLPKAEASLSDAAFSLSGEAPTTPAYDAALAATKQLPAGLTLAKADVLAPLAKPYAWSAAREGEVVTLAGAAPSVEAIAAIGKQAQAAFPKLRVDNQLTLARGAPQGDFAAATGLALGELAKLSKGRVGLDDAALSVKGAGLEGVTAAGLAADLKARLPQGFAPGAVEVAELTPLAKPYVWGAARQGDVVTLTGHAPAAEAIAAIEKQAQAAFPKLKIDNRMSVARGEPQGDFGAAAGFALGELAKLSEGRVGYADTAFSLSGLGLEGVTAEGVAADAKALPKGFSVGALDLREPGVKPYLFAAEKSGDRVALSGYYPDPQTHAALLDAIKARVPGAKIDDRMKRAAGAPADYARALGAGLDQLARLDAGAFSLSDLAATLKGKAASEALGSDVRRAFAAQQPQGYKAESAIAFDAPPPPPPPLTTPPVAAPPVVPPPVAVAPVPAPAAAQSCDATLKAALAKENIMFETGRATIHRDSRRVLDEISGAAQRCLVGGLKLEISGHTDDRGAHDMNMELSQERADAVKDYMVKAGVPDAALTAVGFGPDRPLTSNATAEGRAQNRRIEMTVK